MALTKIPSSLLDTSGGFDLQGNITLGDNEKIRLGNGPDLDIFHDGSNSYIEDLGDGVLFVKASGGIYFNGKTTDEPLARFIENGAVNLYYDNDLKIATSSTGATVAGTLTVTGDLDITGNVNSYNVTDLDVTDQTITLGAGQTEANSGGSGIIIDGSNASILWDETNDQFDINKGLNVTGEAEFANKLKVYAENNAVVAIDSLSNAYMVIDRSADDRRGALVFSTAAADVFSSPPATGTINWALGVGDSDELSGNKFAIKTGDTNFSNAQFVIDTSGNVGIGLTNPDTKLHVYNGTSGTIATISGPNNYNAESGLEFSVGRAKISGFLNGSGGTPGSSLRFYTMPNSGSVTERMSIDSSGNVDINTGRLKIINSGTDAYFLEGVRDGGNTTLRMYDNNNNLYIDSYTNMSFRANQTGGGSGGNFFFGGGNVGIGLPSGSPDAKLTVSGSANSEQVIITGNGNQSRGLSILTAATGGQQDAKVIFNAQDTENVAYPAMQFETGGTEKIRMHHKSTIFSNRVGLNYPSELMFNGEYTAGQQDVAVEAGHAARIEFLKDDFFRIQGSASVSAGAGVSYTDKLKVNIDSGGILFGSDTAAANTLDDYEEGNWTPAISGATHTVQQGFYTKVGDLVFFKFRIAWSAYNNAAGGVLTGLPFTADAAIESMGVSVYVNSGFGSIPSGKGYLNAYVASNNTTLNFNWQPNTAVAEFASSGNIYVAGTYLT